MKTNLPITLHEVEVKPGQVIVSKTDTKGVITYVNRAFIEVSGFTESELLGKSHNIVRHPDMPPAAFADLWATLKRGHPWTGVVKNRCKNGDFYWVVANVTPIVANGAVVEYMSVRRNVSREQISEAESIYHALKENRVSLDEGKPVDANAINALGAMARFSLTQFKYLTTLLMLLAAGGVLGNLFLGNVDAPSTSLLLCSVVASIVASIVQYAYLDRLSKALGIVESCCDEMTEGDFDQSIDPHSAPMAANTLRKLKSLQIRTGFELSNTKKIAEEATRIKQALDVCNTSVILVDNKQSIIYMNLSATAMLTGAESDIRSETPDFGVSQMLGGTLGQLGVQADHLSNGLTELTHAAHSELHMGGRTFNVELTPVFLGDGSRFGTVLEWLDMTVELRAQQLEREKQAVAARVAQQNERIKQALDHVSTPVMVADKERNIVYKNNAFATLINKFNPHQSGSVMSESTEDGSSPDISPTDLAFFYENPNVQHKFAGFSDDTTRLPLEQGRHHLEITLSAVKNDVGDNIGVVSEWIDKTDEINTLQEINEIVASAGQGCLSSRINEFDKTGFFQSVSLGLNQLLDLCESLILEMDVCLAAIAKGNLTTLVMGDYKGDFAHLKNNTNNTIGQLTSIIDQIRTASNCILLGTNEIALGNTHLSQRTEEQASSLEETASSMEEMTSAVANTSDSLQRVCLLSDEAKVKAQQGGDIISLAVSAMEKIRVSSKKIEDIIGVIDGIAFQTNLLALNAAVEAARAGDAGRGFAVVAAEVRALSQRSASAAKEIKQHISESVMHVGEGADFVSKSGKTLEDIVAAVNAVNTLAASVAEAAKEQTLGIQQVNRAVAEMDSVTQQNAALVEEASAASMAVSEQAQQLEAMIGFFRLKQEKAKTKPLPGKPSTSRQAAKPVADKTQPAAQSTTSDIDDWEVF